MGRARLALALTLALMLCATLPTPPPAAPGPTAGAGRVHVVKAGDTLRAIAARYGVSIPSVVAANRLPSASAPLQVGQRLTIPSGANAVSGGERTVGVRVKGADAVKDVKGQRADAGKPVKGQRADAVKPVKDQRAVAVKDTKGQRPEVMNGRRNETASARRAEVASVRRTPAVNGRRPATVNGRPLGSSPPPSSLVLGLPNFAELVPLFAWPIDGPVSSTFGLRRMGWHQGIDIKADLGTPVSASAPGVVVSSGYEPRYGRVIRIEHMHGFMTVYAHNDENRVEVGDRVMMGQNIASVGRTGRATAHHVHFEIRQGGLAYNPLYMLPLPPRVTHVEDGDDDESEDGDE